MRSLCHMAGLIILCLFYGCADTGSHSMTVCMLVDTSDHHAEKVIVQVLTHLKPGDTLLAARVDSGGFTGEDIISTMTFDGRPSMANRQKIIFKKTFDEFISKMNEHGKSDIKGALDHAGDALDEIRPAKKLILIVSDLEEELPEGYAETLNIGRQPVSGLHVVALNTGKPDSGKTTARHYEERVAMWEKAIEQLGGTWERLDDIDELGRLWVR